MSFRAQELCKKIARKMGDDSTLTSELKRKLKRNLPNNKVVMGRADRGIFAGRHIHFGNKVSEDGGNKTRRSWKPNVQDKRLYSYIFDRFIPIKVTTHAIRCIDKAGGIDDYLLKTPYTKMDNEMGVLWKAKIEKEYKKLENTEGGILSLIENRRKDRHALKESVQSSDVEEIADRNKIDGETKEGIEGTKEAEPELS